MNQDDFTPTITWDQNRKYVFLSLNCDEPDSLKVDMSSDDISLKYNGQIGTSYNLTLDLYLPIIEDESSTIRNEKVVIKLRKMYKEQWKRLTYSKKKLPSLKVEFNHFIDDGLISDAEDSLDDGEEPQISVKYMRPTKEMIEKRKAEEEIKLVEEDWASFKEFITNPTILYLIVLKIFQIACNVFIVGWITLKWAFVFNPDGKYESINKSTYERIVDQILLSYLVSGFEILNSITGIQECEDSLNGLFRFFNRSVVLWVAILPNVKLHEETMVTLLFAIWAFSDLIKQVNSLIVLFKETNPFFVYLVHTIWMPLYPLSFMLEGYTMMKVLPDLVETNAFSLMMPNRLNVTFYMPYFIQIYILLSAARLYYRMKALHKIRADVIGPKQSNYVDPNLKKVFQKLGFYQEQKPTATLTRQQQMVNSLREEGSNSSNSNRHQKID